MYAILIPQSPRQTVSKFRQGAAHHLVTTEEDASTTLITASLLHADALLTAQKRMREI